MTPFCLAPHAEGIEVFEGEPERIHAVVAGLAEGVAAMQFEGFAQGGFTILEFLFCQFEIRNVGWGWRSRGAEDLIEEEDPAFDG